MTRKNAAEAAENGVAQQLQADILSEYFRPGEWLKQADIENRYNANRFEVRMALSALAAKHLIDHVPNRGYRVINPSDRERAELYEVRTILETAAGRLAMQKCTDDDVAELGQMVEDFEAAINTASRAELIELNMAFHNKFYSLGGNDLLITQIRELRDRGLPGREGGWETVASLRASNEDHRQMVEMLRRKDADGLNYTIYRHLNRWREFSKPVTDENT
ncbi:GntR family transcriptional regulator [Kordiimonas lacus]|uniref:DNA-binding transcriptional regulator, GntR family n=1 Tax=Kordiimonas lacus TaxID=637679 RepID=A0A1G7EUC2_9PROT|nr:GntR family transcriptional regulator [Kordiimonas lacus]SDE67239.1 DNA-binding transcriptional regulator, GntR family [Kordiimonas lacus]